MAIVFTTPELHELGKTAFEVVFGHLNGEEVSLRGYVLRGKPREIFLPDLKLAELKELQIPAGVWRGLVNFLDDQGIRPEGRNFNSGRFPGGWEDVWTAIK